MGYQLYSDCFMVDNKFISWGRLKHSYHNQILDLNGKFDKIPVQQEMLLAIGNGRSYGDEAYNDNGILINGMSLNKFINFDRETGTLTAECGITLEEILDVIVPAKWFLPVTPGTKYVTLAGAIANDVHGKNHHCVGSFGCFIEEFGLLRTNGEYLECSRIKNQEMFYATIGGMGLTGVIPWAKIKLLAIKSNVINSVSYKFNNLQEYFALNAELERKYTYTVSWIDCLAKGDKLGRGVFFVGEHSIRQDYIKTSQKKHNVFFNPPISLINNVSLRLFNNLYYNKAKNNVSSTTHYEPFFYPLDKILNWNRLYGSRGFYQYQMVVPFENAYDVIKEMLSLISKYNMGSFLAVLKTFGDKRSGGMMSFPRTGVTLALDFPNQQAKTLKLFKELDSIVLSANGAIYPAKDATMSKELFINGYKNLEEFIKYKDPGITSNLWRRVSP